MYEVRVQTDIPEPRTAKGRLAAGYDGTMLAQGYKTSGIWVDPCTLSAMLTPLPLTELWSTSYTGNYARVDPNAAYTIPTPAKWERVQIRAAGDFFLRAKQATDEVVALTTALPANQPMFFTFYKPDVKTMADAPILRLYYNYNVTTTASEIKLVFYANGKCEIYRGGVLDKEYSRQSSNFAPGSGYTGTYSTNQQFNDVLVIPMRRRELLVHTNYGLSFCHVFNELDEALTTNAITPAGTFAFNIPAGKMAIQVAKCLFSQSGTFMASQQVLRYAPASGAVFNYTSYYDACGPTGDTTTVGTSMVWEQPGASWTAWPTIDNGTTSAWDGVKKTVRFKVSLTNTTRTQTPTVYAGEAYYDAPPTQTYSAPTDITAAIKTLSISVNEDGRASLQLDAWLNKLVTAGVPQAEITSDRPVRVQVKTVDSPATYVDLFIGTLSAPKITRNENDYSDNWSILSFEGKDRSDYFDTTMVQSTPALDAYPFGLAIRNLVRICGFVDNGGAYDNCTIFIANDGSPSEFTLPRTTNVSKGDWAWAVERGETVGGALDRLQQDFAATYVKGWFPNANSAGGYTYAWETPNTTPSAVDITVYQKLEDATDPAKGALAMPYASFCVLRTLDLFTQPAECNSLVVIGRDPRTGQTLYGYYQDGPSQDPTTAPASRPVNWRGRPVFYVLQDPTLTTQTKVDYTVNVLAQRLTNVRDMVEFTSDILFRNVNPALPADQRPIWINDIVRLMGPNGTSSFGWYRIVAIPNIDFVAEAPGRVPYRQCTYRAERVTMP